MDEHDKQAMARYQITAETKVVFHYDGHRYDRLADAINYAKTRQPMANDIDQEPDGPE